MGTAARHITRSSNEGAHTPPPTTTTTSSTSTTTTTEECKAGINCEGDDGERAEEQKNRRRQDGCSLGLVKEEIQTVCWNFYKVEGRKKEDRQRAALWMDTEQARWKQNRPDMRRKKD
ncbi:hypothetical protein Q5P01_025321 [Channa striata]|uniref:Uncharacterized protein n=1 Tax=Channa striata TaxID=64152 RepID=A0AA88IN43_CHASR|nr:hypothetical protein Q5P01_025321 [Channa striata]